MKHENKRTEVLAGLFLLFGMVLLGGLILRFSSIRDQFRERDQYTVVFDDASGLTEGAPVRLGGTTIGRVARTPQLADNGKVSVDIWIYRDEKNRIPRGSRLTIPQQGLLGDSYIAVTRPEPVDAGYHDPGDVLAGSSMTDLGSLQESAGKISVEVESLVKELRKGVKGFDAALERLNTEVLSKDNTENMKTALASLNSSLKKLDEQVLSEENTDNVKHAVANLRSTSDSLAEKVEKLDPILAKGETAVASFGDAANSFKQSGAAFTRAAEKAGRTFGEASDGDGLLAALLNDPKLRDDFKALIGNLRSRGVIFYKDQEPAKPSTPSPAASPPRRAPFQPPRPPGR